MISALETGPHGSIQNPPASHQSPFSSTRSSGIRSQYSAAPEPDYFVEPRTLAFTQPFPERVRVNTKARALCRCAPQSCLWFWSVVLSASEALDRAHKLEETGDSAAARDAFSKALQADSERRRTAYRLRRVSGAVSRFGRAGDVPAKLPTPGRKTGKISEAAQRRPPRRAAGSDCRGPHRRRIRSRRFTERWAAPTCNFHPPASAARNPQHRSHIPDRCVPSPAWPPFRPILRRTMCCPRWPATWSPTASRLPAVTRNWKRPST